MTRQPLPPEITKWVRTKVSMEDANALHQLMEHIIEELGASLENPAPLQDIKLDEAQVGIDHLVNFFEYSRETKAGE